jgi:LPXTG-motif cell wall-anchored protein
MFNRVRNGAAILAVGVAVGIVGVAGVGTALAGDIEEPPARCDEQFDDVNFRQETVVYVEGCQVVVRFTVWEDDGFECGDTTVLQIRTRTVSVYQLYYKGSRELISETSSLEFQERPLTAEETASCVTTTTSPPTTQAVLPGAGPTSPPTTAVAAQGPVLPSTGGSNNVLLLIGGLVALLGVTLAVASRKPRPTD